MMVLCFAILNSFSLTFVHICDHNIELGDMGVIVRISCALTRSHLRKITRLNPIPFNERYSIY